MLQIPEISWRSALPSAWKEQKPETWRGPVIGCSIPEPHPWRDCRRCRNAEMRRWRHTRTHQQIFEDRSRAILRAALARGTILREPCEVCESLIVESHHDDYSFPLHVRWLCHKHHIEVTRDRAEKKRQAEIEALCPPRAKAATA